MKRLHTALAAGLLALPGAALAAAPCAGPDFQKRAEAVIRPFIDADAFGGVVLVAVDGKPVLRKAYGLADREWAVPMTTDAKFRIGSITKQFTATAILQLAEQGKLSIDDPVSKYYPQAPAAWSKVTIRHLLTHTSGIPSYTALASFPDHDMRLKQTPEELIALTRDKPLQFEPGSKFAYDNSGYILLGYVVEKASGQRYADYLKAHVFQPLGMHDTGYDGERTATPHHAHGYVLTPDGWENAAYIDMSVPFAAGALYSTVDDLLIWDQALYAGKPLAAASMAAMFTDYGHHYGFGWQIDRKWDHDRIWHDGGINGFITSFQRFPKDHLTVVVLSNRENPAPGKIGADLAGLCLGGEVSPRQVALPAATLDRYAGDYRLGGVVVHVARADDHLLARSRGQPDTPLYPMGERLFFAKLNEGRTEFQTDDRGRVIGALLTTGGDAAGGQKLQRIDAAQAKAVDEARAAHFAAQTAAPGAEQALRRVIGELQRGQPDYGRMSPSLAEAVKRQAPLPGLAALGELQGLAFKGVGPGGADIYAATFANGQAEWRIAADPDGTVETLLFRPMP